MAKRLVEPLPRSRRRRPTSYDVAQAAGVSQSAVSRCFTPGSSVAPTTRERITRIATELGYRPNALAQALISGRTNLVAVLISRLTNLYYPEVLDELTARLTLRGMRVLLFALEREPALHAQLDEVWRHDVDGVISAARLTDEHIEMFADRGVPLVLYNRTSEITPVASVSCDSVAGERLLIAGLLATGLRRFGVIAGPTTSFVGETRRAAALQCLAEAGVEDVPVERGDFGYQSGGHALRALMEKGDGLQAVIAANDLMAIGAIDAARDALGLSVPEDLSIVGFDGADPASWQSYRVTSIRQPVGRMTEAAVSMLVDRMRDRGITAEKRLFAGELIVGSSARIA